MQARFKSIVPLLLSILVLQVVLSINASAQELPRNETIYVGGGLWAPSSNFNPLTPWAAATGSVGLIYEPLFLYIPIKDEFVPWLAEEGKWVSDNVYEVKLREAKWHDGTPLTAEDVKFTFEYAKIHQGIYYSSIWNWLDRIEVVDERTVRFVFSEPHYPEWTYYLYTLYIIPKHIWEKIENPLEEANTNPIGSGMYKLKSYDQNQVVYERNDEWWGKDAFGTPGPKYIVYLRVASNNVALAMLVRGELDWSNFFLPGVPQLVKQYEFIHTWYKDRPYHLPANVAFLFINNQKYPLNLTEFRRAMAYAINVDEIIERVFEGTVLKSNSVGFLPIPSWQRFYAKDLDEEMGFKYDPDKANEILDKLGFKDIDGDGYRETPSGERLRLTIIVPFGWTDWMESIRIIAENLGQVGINVEPKFPDFSKYFDDLTKGYFDLAINNFNSFVSPTPWTMYNWLFYEDTPPIGENSWNGNFGRYFNDEITQLLGEVLVTPMDDEATLRELYRKIQEIFLRDLPYIPLWYNGFWFQASTLHWTGWPSEDNPYGVPVTWPGNWQLGGVLTLLNLKPVVREETKTTTSPVVTTVTKTQEVTETVTVTEKGQVVTKEVVKTQTTVITKTVEQTVEQMTTPTGGNNTLIAVAVVIIVVLAALALLRRR
ncbi:MAG: ABC transporter substrate-binding protein [Desulfurococcales archaeon]|nr:ABC transporter substrate-binding protein [Desulfurococcales archaeon]